MFGFDIKNKKIINYISCLIAVLALVTLIIYGVYMGKGGASNAFVVVGCVLTILAEVFLFIYDGFFADFIGIAVTLVLAFVFGLNISSGLGNILDSINNFHIYGEQELASFNVTVAVISGIALVLSMVSCFFKKDKSEQK